MASTKSGLSYYTIDTDRYQDRRIKRLKKSFGCQGVAVYDFLLCEVYRVNGCFSEWDQDTAFDVAEYFGLKESVVNEIVKYCGAVGLFDATLLSRGIITSPAIQRRYLEMCGRAKRTNVIIPEECRILPEKNEILPENSGSLPNTRATIKEKKRKVNKNTLSQPSESKEIDELLAQQREIIFSIFFFKNFVKPEQEVENFITHYTANGWRRSGGIAIKTAEQLIACAQQWRPKEEKSRFDENLLVRYHLLWRSMEGEVTRAKLLHGLVSLRWADFSQKQIVITGTRELCELLLPIGQNVAIVMKSGIKIVEYKQQH